MKTFSKSAIFVFVFALSVICNGQNNPGPANVSGVFPSLAMTADHFPRTEAGTGALMPWANRLWVMTYVAHLAGTGSGTGLYEIDQNLQIKKNPASVVGTYANRLVHTPSMQLAIGPYLIDTLGNVRLIKEFKNHRLAATMTHLTDPANKLYYLAMEGQFFEVDVHTLEVKQLFQLMDELKEPQGSKPHFKSGFTAHGRVVVCNNSYNEKDYNGEWKRYRLPKASRTWDETSCTEWMRIREIETERAMMDCHGLFYEIGMHTYGDQLWAIKPISSHLRVIPDFCSWRGMLVFGGNQATPMKFGPQDRNPLAGQSQAGLWFGKTDDLWNFGKAKGYGGVWYQTGVASGELSDPYLMNGFDKKSVHLYHDSAEPVSFTIQTDFMGNGDFRDFKTIVVKSKEYVHYEFPESYSAIWMRLKVSKSCKATAIINYN